MNSFLPVRRPKAAAHRYYNRISSVYDWLTSSEKPLIGAGVNLLMQAAPDSVLEIGSSTGTALSKIAASSHPPKQIIGLDLSRLMLHQAREKVRSMPVCVLLQADATDLPLQDNIFAGAFCSFTLELFTKPDIHKVLDELQRVLIPGGTLVNISLVNQPRTLPLRLYELAHRLFPVLVDCRPIPLAELLQEVGFTLDIQKKVLNWGLPIQITRAINPE